MSADSAVAPSHGSLIAKHWMLVFVPIAIAVEHMGGVAAPVRFLLAALAIVPIAHLISASTEHLSHYAGESVGGLLNATFGNLPELIIAIVALKAGLYSMVAASLVGAVLFAVCAGYQIAGSNYVAAATQGTGVVVVEGGRA